MKFLYLKGIDIFGPFEADEIVKEDCFSDDLLVCPENKAEQEAAWKPAAFYEEFKNALEKAVFPIKSDKPIVNDNHNTSNLQSKTVGTPQDLPPLEDTTTDTDSELPNFEHSFEQIMGELSGKKDNDSIDQYNDIDDHTFHIERQEDNLLEDLPAHSLIGNDDSNENKENKSSDQDHSAPLAADAKTIQTIDDIKASSTDLVEISNNKIISSSDGRVEKRRQNDLLFMLSFLAITVIAIALCFAFFNMMKDGKDAINNQNQTMEDYSNDGSEEISKKLIDISKKPEEISVAAQPEELSPVQVTTVDEEENTNVEDQVINIVKNTKLPSKNKTIGEYFKDIYGIGYQSSWSAKPFTDKVYIVEFFASQVRKEPYVYLFRVDTDQEKITGALNNITLDLLA